MLTTLKNKKRGLTKVLVSPGIIVCHKCRLSCNWYSGLRIHRKFAAELLYKLVVQFIGTFSQPD